MWSDDSITISNLNKVFAIYQKPEDRLKQMVLGKLLRKKFYQEFWALRDIHFSVARGETVAIVGKNGAGKSTLLQIIAGTLQPTSGKAEVKGRVAALLELGAGFNPEFTGHENIFLSASILGLTQNEIIERLPKILEFAGIGDFINQPVKLYSSGMYARLAFAVAAHVDADVLIVDEILAVGDAAFSQKCMRFINEFRKRGTLLFVSHDTTAVVSLCSKALWLENGMVRAIGSAKEVCHDYIAAINQERDDASGFKIGGSRKTPEATLSAVRDPRQSNFENANTFQVFQFDSKAPWFGHRGATIEDVRIEDPSGNAVPVLNGGEEVVLRIRCWAEKQLQRPIIGFYVKNKLGQFVFGDNTYLTYATREMVIHAQSRFSSIFRFQMPYLPSGDYAIVAAVAEGTQAEHTQHHWIDEALFFRVHSSFVAQGLVGIPMLEIVMEQEPLQLKVSQGAHGTD